jgi:N-acetylmuramoyl-L-alanine amidase
LKTSFALPMKLSFVVCLWATTTLLCTAQTVVIANQPEQAATTQPGVMNKTTVVLDAGHGGADHGAHISDSVQEKDVTLALALKLQAALTARGLTVVMIRASDTADRPTSANNASLTAPSATPAPLTLDDRAGLANHARASACLLLHATNSGHGVHLFASELDGVMYEAPVLPWSNAQAAWVLESAQLERKVSDALRQANIPRIASKASIRPVDSLTCPAIVVELAPENEDVTSINNGAYQQRVADGLAGALDPWSKQVQAPNKLLPPPKPKPAPKVVDPTAAPAGTGTPVVQR